MSSYVEFWVRNKKGAVVRIDSYSRSNKIYQAIDEVGIECEYEDAPEKSLWERRRYAVPFTESRIHDVMTELNSEIEKTKNIIKDYKDKIELVKSIANSPLEEKMSYINDYLTSIEDWEQELTELEYAKNFVFFLSGIKSANSYGLTDEEKDKVLWVGIDCNMKGEDEE